jgi:hypothetical protein
MKKIVKLTESDLSRIVKRIINENTNQIADEFYNESKRLSRILDDYNQDVKKGQNKKIEESKEIVKRHIRRMENILDDLKRKFK